MRTFAVTERWRNRWPEAVVACLVVKDVSNPASAPALSERLTDIELELRARYRGLDRAAIRALPPFDSYARYYKAFGQNYHVLH